ncbi:protein NONRESPONDING TO OXYLIPINS 2, mitochondrial-like [Zingiber officinale]|uniref:protein NONRESPONDING TO OXYLIPINS 2, mitochondrial-like n=1 Tax=Zingiber officinale TaxID=94328 RepID=UPI001C4DB429|nr:protein NONRESPONDING TO OXYLIPINS 2, mitochondrial-like isoform X1 [Zingiber officinale]XP_042380994.1 protein NONRESPONDING TO OXYLIPINS 2, mitochondrial-like isoform X2 [Zingiber officinale]XP_042447501.1 protein NONRESPONDING TO OXYLIPINS 2, mitochondrial-like [Zingiber officinale]
MASRYRSISRPALSFLNHARTRNASPLLSPNPSILRRPRSPSVSRELGALCTLLPLYSAVSSARLISRLGIDASGSSSSRSLSQELGLSVPR